MAKSFPGSGTSLLESEPRALAKRGQLLELDPDLGRDLQPRARLVAERAIPVDLLDIAAGTWDPPQEAPEAEHLGYLVIEGLMVRELVVAGGRGLEILDECDLVVPWHEDAVSFARARWRVLSPTRLAVLDARVAAIAGRIPGLQAALLRRAIKRSRALAVFGAIAGMSRLEDRLLAFFWALAECRGMRRGDGVHIRKHLTHQMLAYAVGARRPSVSAALHRLDEAGLLGLSPDGEWVLHGDPPGASLSDK